MASVLLGLITVSVVGIWHSEAAVSDGAAKCEGKSDGSCADARPDEEADSTYMLQLRLQKEDRIQSDASSAHRPALMKYAIQNISSAFSAEQVQALLDKWEVKHAAATSSAVEDMYTEGFCWVMEHPPIAPNSAGEIVAISGKDDLHTLGEGYPDLSTSVVGDVVAAGNTITFTECSTGTEAEGLPSGGRAVDSSLTLTSIDGVLKIVSASSSNWQTPCPDSTSLVQLKLRKKNRIQTKYGSAHRPALMKYGIQNISSAFSAEQVQALLANWEVKHEAATSSAVEDMYTEDCCWIMEHPPTAPDITGEIVATCGKDKIHTLAEGYPDVSTSVVGDVVAACNTITFTECSTGTEAEGLPSGGRAVDSILTLTSVDGVLKIESASSSNWQTPCPN